MINYIKVYGKTYQLDMDAITNWCLSTSGPFKETEINEGYDMSGDGEMKMISKVVRELKTSKSQDDTIKYDLVKMFLLPFLSSVKDINEIENNFSHTLLFNTLVKMKFLIEITD